MMAGRLRQFVGEEGYANTLLHYGSAVTNEIQATVEFQENFYRFSLIPAAGDALIFADEEVELQTTDEQFPSIPLGIGLKESLGVGHKESMINDETTHIEKIGVLQSLLNQIRVYQFHDTSATARIRNQAYINDNRHLEDNAGNLAAFLFAMKEDYATRKYYDRIIRYIQKILPQFSDFDLGPSRSNTNYISLDWRDRHETYLFGPHQLSDGSLRFMALATLLLQPPATLPTTIVIDEPELGLHPSAMSVLAAMVKIAGQHSQVILATQSPRLVDEFEAHNIVVVERDELKHRSTFRRLNEDALNEWLERYSLSELWEKNVLGGLP